MMQIKNNNGSRYNANHNNVRFKFYVRVLHFFHQNIEATHLPTGRFTCNSDILK